MVKIPIKIKKMINDYIIDIEDVCPIEKVVLFGSYAKGKFNKNSDIDLAIFSNKITDQNRLKFMAIFLGKIVRYKLDFQPLVFASRDYYDDDNDFIVNEIKKDGVEVYSRN